MKKIPCVLLTFILCLSLFVSCTQTPVTVTEPSDTILTTIPMGTNTTDAVIDNDTEPTETVSQTDPMGPSAICVIFEFADIQKAGRYVLKDQKGNEVVECDVANDFLYLAMDIGVGPGKYTLWRGDTQFVGINAENLNADVSDELFGKELEESDIVAPVDVLTDDVHSTTSDNNKLILPNNPGANVEIPSHNSIDDGPVVPGIGHGSENGGPHGYDREEERNDSELSEMFMIEDGENYFVSVRPKN